MHNQRGVIHLVLPLLILLVLGAVIFSLATLGVIKNPLNTAFQGLPGLGSKQETKVSVKTDYSNPFKKETQFINPFEQYKNPFIVSK